MERIDVAGPGFLNLRLSDDWYVSALAYVLDAGERFGAGDPSGPNVQVEFVSADPTGPMHSRDGRHVGTATRSPACWGPPATRLAPVSTSMTSGSQVARFGASIGARARGEDVPEDGYQGEYIDEIAAAIDGAASLGDAELATQGIHQMIGRIRHMLERMGVEIENWFSERTLLDGRFEQALEALAGGGHIYEHDGRALVRTTELGDDKDRVLVRADGGAHLLRRRHRLPPRQVRRGYDRSSTSGRRPPRLRRPDEGGTAALGGDRARPRDLDHAAVNLVEGGERVQMSKRRGEFVTLDDLVDEVGVDAARFFLLMRSHGPPIDFDLELAERRPTTTRSTTCSTPTPGSAACPEGRRGGPSAATIRRRRGPSSRPSGRWSTLLELPDEIAAPRRARAARHHGLRPRAGRRVLGVLPRLPGRGRRSRPEQVRLALCVATRACWPASRPTRGRGADGDVTG